MAAVTCRTASGQRRRWRVGPRRVLAGSATAGGEGRRAQRSYSGRAAEGGGRPANGLAGGGPRGVHWHGEGEVLLTPLTASGARGAEVARVGTGKGQDLVMIPHF